MPRTPIRTGTEIRLRSYPVDVPTTDHFEVASTPLPEPAPGQVLVRNLYMSVDPYMRGRMSPAGFKLEQPLTGDALGQVVESHDSQLQVGDYVQSFLGWRDYYVADAQKLDRIEPVAPLPAYLGTLGWTGFTAYVGLLDVGDLQDDEVVFVSAAAGAVGSVACQIARIKGCRVIGSAGSADKVRWLQDELGVYATINYRESQDLTDALGRAAPDGISFYFDNVGGAHLEAALEHLRPHGRVVVCGMIDRYNAAEPPPGPRNIGVIVRKRLTLKGFLIGDHVARRRQFYADMQAWLAEDRIVSRETIVQGLEKAPEAFIGLFHGDNTGKMLVKIADPEPVTREQ